jgi:hypothetical protein
MILRQCTRMGCEIANWKNEVLGEHDEDDIDCDPSLSVSSHP